MASKKIKSSLAVLVLVGIIACAQSAFADTSVTITKGSSWESNTCAAVNDCYEPYNAKVASGDIVTWTNVDTSPHTVTSGKKTDSNAGSIFDSSLIKAGEQYSFRFIYDGTFDYYCQIHPWMAGIVTVTEGKTGGVSIGGMQITSMNGMKMIGTTMTMEKMMSADGSTEITINTSPAGPIIGKPFTIYLAFKDINRNLIQHQNYIISAMQDGNPILTNATGHTHTGNDVQVTNILTSASPIDIEVTLTGVGLPGTDPSVWTGPKGDAISFHIIPEFGPTALLILVIAIIGVITTQIRR